MFSRKTYGNFILRKVVISIVFSTFFLAANRSFAEFAAKQENIANYKVDEALKNLKSFDDSEKNKYLVEGFTTNVLKKGDSKIIYSVDDKTKFSIVVSPDKSLGFDTEDMLFVGFPADGDKGISHGVEHAIASNVTKKAVEEFGTINHREFNGEAFQDGISFTISNNVLLNNKPLGFLEKMLGNVFNELIDPTFLKDNKETFNREIYKKHENGDISGRAYHEIVNNYIKGEEESDIKNKVRKYDAGGKYEEIPNLSFEELKKSFIKHFRPNNMVLFINRSLTPEEYKEVVNFVKEKYLNRLGESKYNSIKKNKPVNLKYKLRVDDSNRFALRKWDKNSKIFNVHDGKGNVCNFNYVCNKCIDIESLNLSQKDTLLLFDAFLQIFSRVNEDIKNMGYDVVKLNTASILKGKCFITLYGNKPEAFNENVLNNNVNSILKKVSNAVNETIKDSHNKSVLLDHNIVHNSQIYSDKNLGKPDKYRKLYEMKDLMFYSFSKYNTPLSDKVFRIENGEIVDSKEIAEKSFESNITSIFDSLSNCPVLYTDVFEKADVSSKEGEYQKLDADSLIKELPLKINFYEDPFIFRVAEYIMLSCYINPNVNKKGLSYRSVMKAPYVGGPLLCIANKNSEENIIRFLKGEFLKTIDHLKNIKFEESSFQNILISYLKSIDKDISSCEKFANFLSRNINFIEEAINNNYKICGDFELFRKIKERFNDLNILFANREDYLKYREKEKEFERKINEYLDVNQYKENSNEYFNKILFEYLTHKIEYCNIFLRELEKIKKASKTFENSFRSVSQDVLNAIRSVKIN